MGNKKKKTPNKECYIGVFMEDLMLAIKKKKKDIRKKN